MSTCTLNNLIMKLCPDGIEYKSLGEIATDIFRGTGITRDQITETGTPCVRYGEIYTTYDVWFDTCVSYTDESLLASKKYFEHGDVLFAITGESVEDIGKSCVYVGNERCLAGGDIVVLKHNQNPKYMGYVLSTSTAKEQKSKGKIKSKVVHTNVPSIKAIRIPIPPIEVQEEIVRILDNFAGLTQELIAELTAEVNARREQYEYYTGHLMNVNDNVKMLSLGEIGSVKMCKRILKSQTNTTEGIPFYKIGTFGKEADAFIARELFEEYKKKYSYPTKGDILISCSGTIGRTVVFDGAPAYFQDSNIVWLEHDGTIVNNKYLLYCYKKQPWQISTGGTIARLYNDNILKAQIPVPSLEQQDLVVSILERLDYIYINISAGLLSEIKVRQKQYEYYRDKLLTFEEKKS